jgi:heme-degrading monooxygenase HmoA
MISRIWEAVATDSGAAEYAEHFRNHVLPSLRNISGYCGALLLQRMRDDDRVGIRVVTFWESERAIRAFAGPRLENAVVADEARRMLESYDDFVSHFAVIAGDRVGWQ